MTNGVAVASSLAAAGCYGSAAAIQHLAAGRQDTTHLLDLGILGRLLKSPLWLCGEVLSLLGVAAQALALRLAPILVVQPLLVLGLPVAVVLSSSARHRSIPFRDLALSLLCAAAVAAFVLATVNGASRRVIGLQALACSAAGLAAATAVAGLAGRSRHSAVWAGGAAGALLGFASVLLRAFQILLEAQLNVTVVAVGVLLAAAGLLGLLVSQTAYQRAEIAIPLAVLTLVEPIAAALLAWPVLGEYPSYTPIRGTVAMAAAAIGAWTVVLLSRRSQAISQPDNGVKQSPMDPCAAPGPQRRQERK